MTRQWFRVAQSDPNIRNARSYYLIKRLKVSDEQKLDNRSSELMRVAVERMCRVFFFIYSKESIANNLSLRFYYDCKSVFNNLL